MSETRIGVDCKLYVNAVASGDSPAADWEEIPLVADVQVDGTWVESESSARISILDTVEPTTLGLGMTGRVRKDATNAGYNRLRNAWLTREVLDIMELDGAIDKENSTGFRYPAKITAFSEDQSRNNVLYNDFTIKPCASDVAPQSVIVTSGIPVYTEITGAPEE